MLLVKIKIFVEAFHTPSLFSCLDLCCGDTKTCDYVCPRDVENFLEFIRSVSGFELDNVPITKSLNYKKLPVYVPLIYNNSNRSHPLEWEAVAIQLHRLFDYQKGEAKFRTRDDVNNFFGISPEAKLVISGVREDIPLEKYWLMRKIRNFPEILKNLNPTLVTTPNFSSFANAPRWDNFFNMKRVGICWSELLAEGIPTSLYLSGRTLRDWERWTDLAIKRPELKSVSFEFSTLRPFRKEWYVERLVELARNVNRPLQLVIRGGFNYFKTLKEYYEDLTYIDTAAFIKATKREMLLKDSLGNYKWTSVASPDFAFIDDLLLHNLRMRFAKLNRQFAV